MSMKQEDTFEEYLKTVIPASKEEREFMERLRKEPPPTPEEVETHLRASGAWRGRAPKKPHSESTSGRNENKQQGS